MPGLEGTHLGRYRLLRRLGRGGMSEVYLAHDDLMNREVAIKVVSSSHTDYIQRFQREAEAIGRLQHDHILPAYDFGEQPPWHYLVMPYIPYCTLQDVLEKGPLSLEYAGELLQQIASGLQYAHDHGVIHRDIKPSNILLRDDHYIYLADFGLAKAIDDHARVTQTGILLGTPEYMAPELADGPATKSSDVYALGILLYQMVTGQLPFHGDTPLIIYLKQMREQPVQPSRLNPAIPHAIDVVIMRALDKDPRRRFDGPLALAQAYRRAVEETTTQALPPNWEQDSGATVFDIPQKPPPRRQEAAPPPSPTFHLPPSPARPPVEPLMPVSTPRQPDKLILPPLSPSTHDPFAARPPAPASPTVYGRGDRRDPRGRPGNPPAQPPVYPPARSPVSAPQESRNSRLGLSLFIGLLVILFAGLIFYIAASHKNSNSTTGNSATATAAVSATLTTTPSPGTTATPTPTPTRTPTPSPTPNFPATATAVTNQTPLLSDSLSSDNGSWNNDGKACAFQSGAYHVLVNQPNFLQPCMNTTLSMTSAAIKVDLSLAQGSNAGILYRSGSDQFYDFEITSQGQFFFRRHDSGAGANYTYLIPAKSTSAIPSPSGTNTLLMLDKGGTFTFYINGTEVGTIHDTTYTSGQLGFAAGTLPSVSNADASFSNLTVYPMG